MIYQIDFQEVGLCLVIKEIFQLEKQILFTALTEKFKFKGFEDGSIKIDLGDTDEWPILEINQMVMVLA